MPKRDESLHALFRRRRGIEAGTTTGKTVVGGSASSRPPQRKASPVKTSKSTADRGRSTPESRARKAKEQARKRRQRRGR